MTELSLVVSKTINASVEKVFNAWLDPNTMAAFMAPGEGMSVTGATTEPRVGGRFALIMVNGENEIPHGGIYKTITPHSQIIFTWESPFSIDGSLVTLNFSNADGGTVVELNHTKFPSQESRDNHKMGWGAILEKLETALV